MEAPFGRGDSSSSQTFDIQNPSNTNNGRAEEQMKSKERIHEKSTELVVGPEMLAEILNKKRMDLLHSPEVRIFLLQQQSQLSSSSSSSEHTQTEKPTKDISDSCDTQQTESMDNPNSNR